MDAQNPERPPSQPSDTPTAGGRKPPQKQWADVIEEQIREAQKRGEFNNLPGAGKPLDLDVNPYAGDRALAYSLLKAHDMAPPEIELGREVDAERERAEAIFAELRRRRDHLLHRRLPPFASERRAYNVVREKAEQRYSAALRALNSKILSLNITTPALMHRPLVDIEARLLAFHQEFPPLDV